MYWGAIAYLWAQGAHGDAAALLQRPATACPAPRLASAPHTVAIGDLHCVCIAYHSSLRPARLLLTVSSRVAPCMQTTFIVYHSSMPLSIVTA